MYFNVKGKEVHIVHATAEDWEAAMALAWRTFSTFVGPTYPTEGNRSFIDFISGEDLHRMFLLGRYRMYLAKEDGRIIGVISVREHNHLSLLFVDAARQGCGIGRALMECVKDYLWDRKVLPLDNEDEKILDVLYEKEAEHFLSVNAAPNAVEFYKRIGFEQTGGEEEYNGIRYVPLCIHESPEGSASSM